MSVYICPNKAFIEHWSSTAKRRIRAYFKGYDSVAKFPGEYANPYARCEYRRYFARGRSDAKAGQIPQYGREICERDPFNLSDSPS